MTALLRAEEMVVKLGRATIVDGIDLELRPGPAGRGLVGESGSGKTTIVNALVRLVPTVGGRILYRERDVKTLHGADLKRFRREVQVVLQDPAGTLDPRMRTGSAIAEVLRAHRVVSRDEIQRRTIELLEEVGLSREHAGRYPHQLSGGQRQRVSIARALALEPRVLILDEPTSALDVTTQARILDLIERLRDERGLSYLLVSHDLAVVERLCDQVDVLYAGRIAERGPISATLARPIHPYTAALLTAVPRLHPGDDNTKLVLAPGSAPDPAHLPQGCTFHPRCPIAVERCSVAVPPLTEFGAQTVACHRAAEVLNDPAVADQLR